MNVSPEAQSATTFGSYDALLVLSFGGPEGIEEVVPFLENVTRGRGIPRERLEVVGKHYFYFDGVSPINALNREIIANLETEISHRGKQLPIYFGNRNWHPFGKEAVDQLARDGRRNVIVFATSAWGGYSACRQYQEDIVKLQEYAAEQGYPAIKFTKLRQFFDHPLFITEMAEGVQESLAAIPADLRADARLVFTAHSIPLAHDAAGGGAEDKHLYSRQVAEAARLIAEQAGVPDYDLVWNSRSGNPQTPWLEPDVAEHVTVLAGKGNKAVVICPVGFISDHMEVIWDLDTELAAVARELGVHMERSRTVGPTQRFQELVIDLVEELVAETASAETAVSDTAGETSSLGDVSVQGCTRDGELCVPDCCDIWPAASAQH